MLLNELPRSLGNIDHVLIGPAGLFLLETKNLNGRVSVVNDSVDVRWLEVPEDGYVNHTIGRRARGAAAELSRALGPHGPWVQAVVVLWARFEQGSIEGNHVLWTDGERLSEVLRSRTQTRLDESQIARLTEHLRAHAATAAQAPRTPIEAREDRHAASSR